MRAFRVRSEEKDGWLGHQLPGLVVTLVRGQHLSIMDHPRKIETIEALRGAASLYVFLGHFCILQF